MQAQAEQLGKSDCHSVLTFSRVNEVLVIPLSPLLLVSPVLIDSYIPLFTLNLDGNASS